ncbi:unnamed protein product [marine sediment metagenome]|uniref:Uncharacterized protein n=1 Tax=marine sediment metagenome TaxID=412755 RepID=X0VMT6_9ZZZZ
MPQNDIPFSREELQSIVRRARVLIETVGVNPVWKKVYENLELSVSTLDAFIARTELKD